MGETRAGLRRHTGTSRGEHYQTILAHLGTGDASDPPPQSRTLGDWLDPSRPGRATDLVNVVSRDLRADVATWDFERTLGVVALIQQEGTSERRAKDQMLDGR